LSAAGRTRPVASKNLLRNSRVGQKLAFDEAQRDSAFQKY
jgi:hypothetical protein